MAVQLFGKLPTHGDFVVRGMMSEARDALDGWLSQEMTEARALLGQTFEERYDRAPPWRFADGDKGGVLVASMDSAGRRFPLYLAVTGMALELARTCAEGCEELIYRGFGEGWDADRLVAEAAALVLADGEPARQAGWWTEGGEGFAPAERPGAQPQGLLAAMLAMEEDA